MNCLKNLFSHSLKNRAPRLKLARRALTAAAVALAAVAPNSLPSAEAATISDTVRFTIVAGDEAAYVDIRLLPAVAPQNVANFLKYITAAGSTSSPNYVGTYIHRNSPYFCVQGGGYRYNSTTQTSADIGDYGTVADEYKLPNIYGTIAMAKTGDYNSATSEWFFNMYDNRDTLSDIYQTNGGFTVFGELANADSRDIIAYINTTTTEDTMDSGEVPGIATADGGKYLFTIVATELISRDTANNDRVHVWSQTDGTWDTTSNNWQVIARQGDGSYLDGTGVVRPFPGKVEALFAPDTGVVQNVTLNTAVEVMDLRAEGAEIGRAHV
jgi:cyclophilin family peptidyl-prolyl cis-trans isomerase